MQDKSLLLPPEKTTKPSYFFCVFVIYREAFFISIEPHFQRNSLTTEPPPPPLSKVTKRTPPPRLRQKRKKSLLSLDSRSHRFFREKGRLLHFKVFLRVRFHFGLEILL
ncbi:hypothetical protein OIU74_017164, partial [Salix koriyanagi]